MPHLQPKHKISGARLARRRRLASKYPIVTTLIQKIEKQLDAHKYGDSIEELDIKYQFIDQPAASTFLRLHLDGRGQQEADDEYLLECLNRTLNVRKSSESDTTTTALLHNRVDEIVTSINKQTQNVMPILDVIIGTTGAGKTSYSKALFTAGLSKFHENGIIPSRVEFSKFFEGVESFKEEQVVLAIQQSMLRDYIYYARFYLNNDDFFDKLKKIVIGDNNLLEMINNYLIKTENKVPGKNSYTIADATRDWSSTIGYLEDKLKVSECLDLIRATEISFIVSFDGFDVLKTEDFLIKDHTSVPIDALVSLIRSITAKAAIGELKNLSPIRHISLYIRDTTYTRLKIELNRKAGGSHDFVPYWILPPTYKMMTDKIAQLVGLGMDTDEKIHIGAFVNRLEEKVHSTINPFLDRRNRKAPFETSFSFNARNMKRHIIRCIIWCMEDILLHDDVFVRKLSSGVNLDIFWKHVVENEFFAKLKGYQIIEELFLDETHQLRPQFMMSLHSIERMLTKENVSEAIAQLKDYDEIAGFYDCILNYLTRDILKEDAEECLPALMIGIRILQIISNDDWIDYYSIVSTLSKLGYNLSEVRIKFFLYAMIRSELIRIRDDDSIIISIEDCQFSLSKSGLFAINKLIFSVAYIGEAMMLANLPKNGPARFILGRVSQQDKVGWLNSVIINSCLYLEYIQKIEAFEEANCASTVDYSQYRLFDKSQKALQKEVSAILNDNSNESLLLSLSLPKSENNIKKDWPEFTPLLDF